MRLSRLLVALVGLFVIGVAASASAEEGAEACYDYEDVMCQTEGDEQCPSSSMRTGLCEAWLENQFDMPTHCSACASECEPDENECPGLPGGWKCTGNAIPCNA